MAKLHDHEVTNLSNAGRDTTIVSIEIPAFESSDDVTVTLKEAITTLQSALDSIPEQYRDAALFRIRLYGDYASLQTNVQFLRPETDAEMEGRLGWLRGIRR